MLLLGISSFSEDLKSQMLDGAFKQEMSNIIEDTFSAYNICGGRMFQEINKGTACALDSEKYINEGVKQKKQG